MARNTTTKDDIAADLHQWAIKEMHFRPVGRHVGQTQLPMVADFAEICKGPTGNIWQFVINNIHSAQTVRKVRGNLLLKHRQSVPLGQSYRVQYGSGEHYDQGRADLLDKHRSLVGEIMSTRANIGQLEKDLQHTKTELVKVEQQYQNTVNQIRDTQRKASILRVHSQHIGEETEKLAEYKDRINTRVQKLQETAKKSQAEGAYYSRHGSSGSDSGSNLESACTKHVRECCESVGEFLHKLLQGTFGTDKVLMAKSKESLWQQVEKLMDTHSVSHIMLSLSIYTQETSFGLQEKTTNIDIKKDAAELRFKYEGTGQMSDLATTPSLLQSVHQLLEETQKEQIKRFMETERSRNTAWKLQPRIEQSQELLDDCLRQTYRDSDPKMLQLAKSLVDTDLQIATSRCAIRVFEAVSSSLKEKISRALQDKEQLYTKYQSIQDFRKMVENKQNLIRVLVRQNLNARSRLETQQSEISQYMSKSFVGQDVTTRTLTSQLKDSVIQEVNAFAALPLPNLMFTVMDSAYKIAVIDLSINRLSTNQNTASGQVIQKLLQTLEYPPFMAPEGLLPRIVELQSEVSDIEAMLHAYEEEEGELKIKTLVDNMTALCKEVSAHDEQQTERILPVIQKRLMMVTQALTDCLQTKDTIQSWWEQPAQSKVPWIKVDDKTLQQWRDKWTVMITRLRHL